jgi:uncharacterized membrane protein YhaH (DUF805 family)
MKGNVIGFDPDTNTGAISGQDGNRYDFATADWHGRSQPRHGDVVDFQAQAQRATQIYMLEAEYVQPGWGEFLFSPHGRISRTQYWLRWALPVFVLSMVLYILMMATLNTSAGVFFVIIYFIVMLVLVWPNLAILIKRSHDRDWPWPFILLFLVPLLNFWPLIELLFLRGTIGSNRFGPDPVPHT